MKDISQNIKKVLAIFLILFVILMSYLLYIYTMKADKIVSSPYNERLWYERINTERGKILDKNDKVLVESNGIKENNQTLSYKGGAAFAHVLGYMDKSYGLTGLQRMYDEALMGKIPGMFNPITSNGNKKGYDVKTSLDYDLQTKAYELLKGKRGAVVAIEPSTGKVLALVSTPSYDPNELKEQWKSISTQKDSPLLNRATAGLYPPGSSFKIVTATSALNNISGVQNKTFRDTGVLKFNDSTSIKNYGGEALGNVNFKKAIAHSSNVIFAQFGIDLGNSKLKETAEQFMFNKDIPSEGLVIENSRFPELKEYEKGNLAQSAIGQGSVLSTPLQMALVASSVANDGKLMKPIVVTDIYKNNKSIQNYASEQISQPLTKEKSDILKEAMREVVTSGTGKKANAAGLNVCGKTGTAEHVESSIDHSWFIGFAPQENPKIALAVLVEEGGTGGSTSAPIAKTLFKTYLKK